MCAQITDHAIALQKAIMPRAPEAPDYSRIQVDLRELSDGSVEMGPPPYPTAWAVLSLPLVFGVAGALMYWFGYQHMLASPQTATRWDMISTVLVAIIVTLMISFAIGHFAVHRTQYRDGPWILIDKQKGQVSLRHRNGGIPVGTVHAFVMIDIWFRESKRFAFGQRLEQLVIEWTDGTENHRELVCQNVYWPGDLSSVARRLASAMGAPLIEVVVPKSNPVPWSKNDLATPG